MTKLAITLGALVFTLMIPAASFAQESVQPEPIVGTTTPAKPISAALLLGFGTDLGEDGNPYGLGLGVRGGYNLDRLYLGGVFIFHLGSSYEAPTAGFGAAEWDVNIWQFGGEVGYDFYLMDRFTLRPSVILGIAGLSSSSDTPLYGGSFSDTKLILSLGATALYDVTPDIFVGGDLRFPLVLGGGSFLGLAIYATGGMRF